jgi:hypothetical protein
VHVDIIQAQLCFREPDSAPLVTVLLAAFSRRLFLRLFLRLPPRFALVAKPVTLGNRLQWRVAAECVARKITAFAEQHLFIIFFVVVFAHLRGDTFRHETRICNRCSAEDTPTHARGTCVGSSSRQAG